MKKQNGVTLIALVITIIVLLILAGVSISTVVGNNGVLTRARSSVEKNREAEAKEEVNMAWSSCEMAYQTAWAGNTAVQRNEYYTKEEMNKSVSSTGEVLALVYNENGDSEVTYQSKNQGITYMFKISATGEITNIKGLSVDARTIYLANNDTEGKIITAAIVGVDGKTGSDIVWTVIEGNGIITKTDIGADGNTSKIKILPTGTEGTAKIQVTCGEYNQEIVITSKVPMAYIENLKYYEYEGAEGEQITKDNFGKFLGKRIKYVPSNLSTNTSYGTSDSYRIFYIDFDNKYQDGVGTIYLKADVDGKKVHSLGDYVGYTSTDNYEVMKKLNPSWVRSDSLQSNDKCVSWITDSNVWTDWKDITTENIKNNINYVVGAPSLEIYIDSYNAYLDAHPGLYKNDGINLAEKLACEYVTSGYKAKGYRIGFLNIDKYSWVDDGYAQDKNSLIRPTTSSDKMYNPNNCESYCLASPSTWSGTSVMYVYGTNNSRLLGNNYYYDNNSFCPVVSLKSEVKLTIMNE